MGTFKQDETVLNTGFRTALLLKLHYNDDEKHG